MMGHHLFNRVTRRFARLTFPFFERVFNLHITPNDYYSPIPSVKDLPTDIYDRRFDMGGVDMNLSGQTAFLRDVLPLYLSEFTPKQNGGLSLADAYVLYALIRHRKPSRMVEIGGGDSTFISMAAIERNRAEGHPCHFTCIEPYPRDFLTRATWPDYRLVVEKVQDADLSIFADIDMLFIDSSHVSKIGSDVNHEMFEILPRMKPGSLIHWHDIVIPTNYWRDWTTNGTQFWNESYLLHAFLMFNAEFRVVWAARWFNLEHPDALAATLPFLEPSHRLTSFWVEREK
ncbi:hypothetical protein MACH21_19550 [Roseicyclus marinus]|uniref:Methyltransferase family protein n=2 Tax=Roseicyclus marinus TaxID=2161673 RepID=A0AA48HCI6_9RHOB|nr:hypothetical protein MACH21_19550 [Roseicyclus marinus]